MTHNTREVEEWERELDRLSFYEEEASIFEVPNPDPNNLPKIKRLNAEHLGDVQYKLIPAIKNFIREELAKVETQAYRRGYEQGRFDNEMELLRDIPPSDIHHQLQKAREEEAEQIAVTVRFYLERDDTKRALDYVAKFIKDHSELDQDKK